MTPANTGTESNNDQANIVIPAVRMLMKFTARRIEEILARCSLKIARSTEAPLWSILAESGGYTVYPVPIPVPGRTI